MITKIKENRTVQRVAVGAMTLALVVGAPSAAFAQTTPTDPLDGAGDSAFTDLKSYLTTKLIPAVIGLALVGLAAGLLFKWLRKGKAAA